MTKCTKRKEVPCILFDFFFQYVEALPGELLSHRRSFRQSVLAITYVQKLVNYSLTRDVYSPDCALSCSILSADSALMMDLALI